MALVRLEPRGVFDIVRATFSLYGEMFTPVIAIVVVLQVPLAFLASALSWLSRQRFPIPEEPAGLAGILSWPGWAVEVALFLLSVLVSLLVLGALARGVSRHLVGQPVLVGDAYGPAQRRLASLLGASLLFFSLVGLLLITIIGIPLAIYFGVTWSFIVQVVVIEGCRARQALGRSSSLVKGNWWRVFGLVVILGLLSALLFTPLAWAIGLLAPGNAFLNYLLGELAAIFIFPLGAIASILMYYDLRVRKEGYSLHHMALELGGPSPGGHGGEAPLGGRGGNEKRQ